MKPKKILETTSLNLERFISIPVVSLPIIPAMTKCCQLLLLSFFFKLPNLFQTVYGDMSLPVADSMQNLVTVSYYRGHLKEAENFLRTLATYPYELF